MPLAVCRPRLLQLYGKRSSGSERADNPVMETSRSPALTPEQNDEHGKLLSLDDAEIGLDEVLAGAVLSRDELDRVLTELPPP